MSEIKVLFAFSSPRLTVLEIKRPDLPDGSPLAEIFKWIVVVPGLPDVLELDFRSMESRGAEERRSFAEGELRWGVGEARLRLLGEDFELTRIEPSGVNAETIDLVHRSLTGPRPGTGSYAVRRLRPSDVRSFETWIRDPEVIRYSMTKFHRISSDGEIRNWFRTTLFDRKTYQFGITDPGTGALIGYAGISALNEIDGNCEYFIFIGDKRYWGRGIATEVTRRVVWEGFEVLNLHRIFLTASSRNPGALRAYEKAGLVFEGRLREAFFRGGEYSDKIVMGILRREYEQER
jgi:RimJ/RimL family protein N-acetyltransferase